MIFKILFINLLTLIRVIGTIILIPLYTNYGAKIVGITSLICYATDSIDGIFARHFKASTFFGALFDGIADKLFTIVNFIILYMITPYAIIPIVIEILIVLVQLFKFNKRLNIQSNIIGKFKVWVLAFCVVLTFLVSDINSISFINESIKTWVLSINTDLLYLCLLLPAIIMEFLTLLSYIYEIYYYKEKREVEIKKEIVKGENKKKKSFIRHLKDFWFNPEFYLEHKDDNNLRDLRKDTK